MESFNYTSVEHIVKGVAKDFLPLFYLVAPSQSSFATLEEIPNYVVKTIPYFVLLIFVEGIVRILKGLPRIRANDGIASMTAGLMMTMADEFLLKGVLLGVYVWLHENYRLVNLPWDSSLTWWLTFFAMDMGYYWFHRMAHEINIMWALHQMHHSSEEYNLTTAVRQGTFQRFGSMMVYLLLAPVIPPTQFVVHKAFNTLYQFWIHTEIVGRLGPLEYVLNTPSHHRVHHGRNRYCIDKNYAGVLIIWDRMFGTFQPEQDKIYYGLVHPLGTFDPIWSQMCQLVSIAKRAWLAPGLWNKVCVVFNGPGWTPGKPRLGDPTGVPEVPVEKVPYDRKYPLWVEVYCVVHFFVVLVLFQLVAEQRSVVPYLVSTGLVLYFVVALTSLGMIFDCRPSSPFVEMTRLLVFIVVDRVTDPHPFTTSINPWVMYGLRLIMLFSAVVWTVIFLRQVLRCNEKKHSD